ncbi:MAG: hypothetical protein HYR67_04230, partial [Bacteroidetes bacterium]|nr:hypothetical protein [Bacteroidota bacterium]
MDGYYAAGVLYTTTITDEDGNTVTVFKDKSDKEVMKRSLLSGQKVETYYVYDGVGNLRFVIPPQAIAELPAAPTATDVSTMKSKWVTEYHYDGYNRLIEKIMPEENMVITVYDQLGRVVLRQDGNMNLKNDWFFTKYDKYSRVIMTGVYNDLVHTDRTSMQTFIDGLGIFYEMRTANNTVGYTTSAGFPIDETNIWTITYYDDYDFNYDGTADAAFIVEPEFPAADYGTDTEYPDYWITGHTPFYRITDNVTKTKVREFDAGFFGGGEYSECPPSPQTLYYKGSSITLKPGFDTHPGQNVYIGANITLPALKYIETVNFYDTYGRVIQTQTTNHLGGTDIASTQYDFSGKVLRTKLTHMKNNTPSPYTQVTVAQRFKYDNAARLVKTYQRNNSDPEVIVSQLTYNDLGQVWRKKLHSIDNGVTFFQSADYTYNERGWLVSVNNPYNLSDANAISNDLFGFKLLYNVQESGMNLIPSSGFIPKYNGNISGMVWNSNVTTVNGYDYGYDNLNRLQGAWYGTYSTSWTAASSAAPYNETGITYDLNGNMKTILRNNNAGYQIDNLTYTYDANKGNRLDKVEDAVAPTGGNDFSDNGTHLSSGEYLYDANGRSSPFFCVKRIRGYAASWYDMNFVNSSLGHKSALIFLSCASSSNDIDTRCHFCETRH